MFIIEDVKAVKGFLSMAAMIYWAISVSFMNRLWPDSRCWFELWRISIDFNSAETAAVKGFVKTNLFCADSFKVMPSRLLASLVSALYVCPSNKSSETLLWVPSARLPAKTPFINAACSSGAFFWSVFISARYYGKDCIPYLVWPAATSNGIISADSWR